MINCWWEETSKEGVVEAGTTGKGRDPWEGRERINLRQKDRDANYMKILQKGSRWDTSLVSFETLKPTTSVERSRKVVRQNTCRVHSRRHKWEWHPKTVTLNMPGMVLYVFIAWHCVRWFIYTTRFNTLQQRNWGRQGLYAKFRDKRIRLRNIR